MEKLLEIIEKLNNDELPDIESCKRLLYYSLYDGVSGLKNRHAFDLKIKDIESRGQFRPIGIIFADVNALKFMNDHYGHDMGDILIRKCAFLLASYFGNENCYRVSGDEFIVLVDDFLNEEFGDLFVNDVETFHHIIHKKNIPPISLGWYYVASNIKISEAIRIAEERMRSNKKVFYKEYPEFRR